jgi:hypothetical protein
MQFTCNIKKTVNMRKIIIFGSLVVFFSILLAIMPGRTVNKNTPYGWVKIIDNNGDGIADVTLTPIGRGCTRTKPTAEDQVYFKNH